MSTKNPHSNVTEAPLIELPLAVVLAETALDIELALAVAADARVPVVPRGGGTSPPDRKSVV